MLQQAGWTARKIAAELHIGEATAKRWLAGKGLTLDRLDRLAGLVNMSLAELARDANDADVGLTKELTLAQEKALSGELFLPFLFMALLNGVQPYEIAEDFEVRPDILDAALARLERLALIDRLPGDRVRPLVDRAIILRKTPMRALFDAHMKRQFLEMDFARADAVFTSGALKLSARGAAELAEEIERHRHNALNIAERDQETALLPRKWYGMLSALRELDISTLKGGSH